MKYILPILILCAFTSFGQTIEENKIDEFTKKSIRRTSWEKICSMGFSSGFTGFVRVSKINDTYFLGLKAMTGNVFAVNEGDELMLKTKTDSVITLKNLKYTITCTGCGAKGFAGSAAQGIDLSFILDESQIEFLKKNPIVKVRLYTTKGYLEDEVSEKASKVFMKELEIIQ